MVDELFEIVLPFLVSDLLSFCIAWLNLSIVALVECTFRLFAFVSLFFLDFCRLFFKDS